MNTKLIFWILVGLMCQFSAIGQIRSSVLFEDMNEQSLDVQCFCNPGVRNKTRSKGMEFSYQFLTGGNLRSSDDRLGEPISKFSRFQKFKSKISLPLIRHSQFKSILSLSYQAELYDLRGIDIEFQGLLRSLDNVQFKRSGLDLSFSYSNNATRYIGGKFSLKYNGDYDGLIKFSKRYAVYSGALAMGFKKNENNEWGFGLALSKNFRRQGLRGLPFVFWNKTFDDHWGFQIILPASYKLRFNLNPKTIFVASASYNAESYSFNEISNQNRSIAFNHSEILTVIKMERELIPWVWLDVTAGYNFNYDSDFEIQSSQESLLSIDPENSYVIKFGLFISPPNSFMNKNDHKNKPPDIL